jgi:hypothetical protein
MMRRTAKPAKVPKKEHAGEYTQILQQDIVSKSLKLIEFETQLADLKAQQKELLDAIGWLRLDLNAAVRAYAQQSGGG